MSTNRFRGPKREGGSRAFPPRLAHRAELVEFTSAVLADNPLGDPATRLVATLRPPSGTTEGRPLVVFLPGFLGSGPVEITPRKPFEESFFDLADRLMRTGVSPEATIIAPDPTTSLGGNQYVNSPAVGRYDDHLVTELVPWARERFRASSVGLLGQSSGGFGALHLVCEHPGRFAAVACSAGDMGFEYAYLHDLARACRAYQDQGGPERFLRHLHDEPSALRGPFDDSGSGLLVAAMSASYSPIATEPGAFELPFDWETAEFFPAVWARWKLLDPVHRVSTDEGAAALRHLVRLHVTGSRGDEWGLDQGARWFAANARRARVPVVHDELPGGHFARDARFTALLPPLVQALAAT